MSWPALWAVIFWGFSFIATKVALKEMNPFTLLTLRFGVGGFLLLLVQLQKDRRFLKAFSSTNWLSIIFLAVVGISGHTLLQAFGLLYTTAINTGWIVAIIPIFITIAARFYLGETITPRKIGGIILGFLGIFFVISKGVFSLSIFRFGSTFGDFLVLISALTWTAFTVGGRGFLSRFSPLAAITPIMIVGCFITFPFTWLKWEWNILFHLSLSGWISILFLGVFCSGEKGFKPCRNVPLSGALGYIDRSILSFGRRDSVDHPHRRGDDPPRRLPGHKKDLILPPLNSLKL